VACHFCDTLHEADLVEEGSAAHCRQCGAVLYRNQHSSLARAVAFGITALMFFVLMMIFPFISLDAQGNKVVVSVPEAVLRLWQQGGIFVSVSVALFVITLPFLQILILTLLCSPLLFGRAFPGSRPLLRFCPLLRFFQSLQAWGMVEVFFLGAVVSLLKLIKLAEIELGIGFWSAAGLMICLAGAIGGIDRTELWDRVETAEAREKEGS
jgi:paraquat-inducible protein A